MGNNIFSMSWQIDFLRKNVATRLLWASFIGIIFHYAFSLVKIVAWHWDVTPVFDFFHPTGPTQETIFTVVFNAFVDISSAVPAAFLCGTLLFSLLKDRAVIYGIWSTLFFWALRFGHLNFHNFPDVEKKFTISLGLLLSGSVLMAITFLLVKVKAELRRRIMEVTLSCALIIIIMLWLFRAAIASNTTLNAVAFLFFVLVIATVINILIYIRKEGVNNEQS